MFFSRGSDCHCSTRVFCWFALFLFQRERKRKQIPLGGFKEKRPADVSARKNIRAGDYTDKLESKKVRLLMVQKSGDHQLIW